MDDIDPNDPNDPNVPNDPNHPNDQNDQNDLSDWITGWQEALQTIDRKVYFMNNASADSVSQKFYLHGWVNMYIYSIQEQKWVYSYCI